MGQGRFAILNLNDGCSNRIGNRDRQQRRGSHHRLTEPPLEIQLAPAKYLVSVDSVRSRPSARHLSRLLLSRVLLDYAAEMFLKHALANT